MGQKREHMMDWRTLSKDIEKFLISDGYMRMKATMEGVRVTVRSMHSKNKRITEEFNWKGKIWKTLKNTWFTYTKHCVYLCLINSLPIQNKH